MALSETATLIAQLKLEDQFSGTARKFNSTVTGMDQRTQRLGQLGEHIGQGVRSTIANVARIGVIAGGALAVNVKAGIDSLAELQRVEQLTATALKSTGSEAAGSAEQIRKRSLALEDMTTLDDKAIQNAQNLLLTFRQIGKDAFEPTLQAAIDLNAAMGGDENSLQGALIQVGKAVNDPIKGLTALRRVGVSFTADQEKQIKKLVDTGRAMDAQRVILRELNKEFGGAGKAFGTGPAADVRRLQDAIEDAQQALAKGFLPLIKDVSQRIQEALGNPKVLANIQGLGKGLADAVSNLIDIGTRLPWDAIGSAAKVMGEGAKALLQAFTSLPPWIQTAVLTGWGLNKLTGGALGNIFGDVVKLAFPKLDIFSRGGSPANPMWVQQVGGVPGTGGPGGLLGGGKGFWAGLGATFGLAAAAVIADRIVEETQTGFNNARTFREGGTPTNVNPVNVGPLIVLNRDIFSAIGKLGIALSAGGDLATEINKIPESLRGDVVNAIIHNPLEQKALGLSQDQVKFLDSLDGKIDLVTKATDNVRSEVTDAKQVFSSRLAGLRIEEIRSRQAQLATKLAYDRGVQKTSALLGLQLGAERNTANYTGIISRKDFSPRVAVTVNSTNNISVDDVIRSITHTTVATGSGPGGPAPGFQT